MSAIAFLMLVFPVVRASLYPQNQPHRLTRKCFRSVCFTHGLARACTHTSLKHKSVYKVLASLAFWLRLPAAAACSPHIMKIFKGAALHTCFAAVASPQRLILFFKGAALRGARLPL